LCLVVSLISMTTGSWIIMPVTVRMIIHDPIGLNIYTEDYRPELIQHAREIIASALPA